MTPRLHAGEPYSAEDPELVDDRIRWCAAGRAGGCSAVRLQRRGLNTAVPPNRRSRKLLHKLNVTLEYDDMEARRGVLKELLGGFDEGALC